MTDGVWQHENILSNCKHRVGGAKATCTYDFRLDILLDRGGYIVQSLFGKAGRFNFSWVQVSYLFGELIETG